MPEGRGLIHSAQAFFEKKLRHFMESLLLPHPKENKLSKMQIHIPHPCHQNWNEMTPNGEGRHCRSCTKSVVDFTGMNPEVVDTYLELNATKSICGRFQATQVFQPKIDAQEFVQQVVKSQLSFLKKIAALFVFAFILAMPPTSAQAPQQPYSRIVGEPAPENQHIPEKIAPRKEQDSTNNLSRSVDSFIQKASPTTLKQDHPDHQIMGMIARPIHQQQKAKTIIKAHPPA